MSILDNEDDIFLSLSRCLTPCFLSSGIYTIWVECRPFNWNTRIPIRFVVFRMGSKFVKKFIKKCSCPTLNLILVSKCCVPYNLLMSESVMCLFCMSHECTRISPWYSFSVLPYCSITIPMWIFLISIFFYELQILKYLLCRLIICLSLKNHIICHFLTPHSD